MTGPPHKRRGRHRRGGAQLLDGDAEEQHPTIFGPVRYVNYYTNPDFAELVRNSIHQATRQIWWNLRREGVRLPAEPGVIVFWGDKL